MTNKTLKLMAWVVSGKKSQASGKAQSIMNRPGESGIAAVVNKFWIHVSVI